MNEKLQQLFKFSWAQAFSEDTGKSTVLPIAGSLIIFSGNLGFLLGATSKDSNVLSNSVLMTSIGAALLMGRKMVNGKSVPLPTFDEQKETP